MNFLNIQQKLPDCLIIEGFEQLEDANDIPEFEEKSDVSKFQLAAESLKKIIKEVRNG